MNDRTKKAKEIVRAVVGLFVACDSRSKLWRDMSLKRAMENWSMQYRVIGGIAPLGDR